MKLVFAVLFVTLILTFNESAEIHGKGLCTPGPQEACNTVCKTVHHCDQPCVVSPRKIRPVQSYKTTTYKLDV